MSSDTVDSVDCKWQKNKIKSEVAKTKMNQERTTDQALVLLAGSFKGSRAFVLMACGGVELDSMVKFVAAARPNAGMACSWSSGAVVVVHIVFCRRLQWRQHRVRLIAR